MEEALKTAQEALKLHQEIVAFQHAEAGYSPEESMDMRLSVAKNDLQKTLRFERKTEPARSQWLASCEAHRLLVEELSEVSK